MSKKIATMLLLVNVAAFINANGAFGAHPLITDDTGTQGKRNYQLETTAAWLTDQEDEGAAGVREIGSFASLVFTAGALETVDLVVGVPYVWTETKEGGQITRDDGVSDTVIEAKWRFYDREQLSLAIKPGILIPTGDSDKGLGTGHYGYSAVLISTVEVDRWAFDANIGYLCLENRVEERVNRWLGSIASRFSVSEQWTLVGEVGASRNTDPTYSSHPSFAQIGLIYSPDDSLDLSAGFLAGLNDAEVDQSIRAGVTFRF